jgi:hypothetical protein
VNFTGDVFLSQLIDDRTPACSSKGRVAAAKVQKRMRSHGSLPGMVDVML